LSLKACRLAGELQVIDGSDGQTGKKPSQKSSHDQQ